MAFVIPEGLAPEVRPLAWLLGTWRGPGFLAYPDVPQEPFVQEASFSHDGGPYLAYTATTWLLEESVDDGAPAGAEPEATEVRYRPGRVWATESGFWRVPPQGGPGTVADGEPAGDVAPGATEVEVLLAEPTGHVSVYLGNVHGVRAEIATDALVRTATAAEVAAVHRLYGLVDGDLMWATDMAAFGRPMQSYASARLARVAGPGA